MIRKDKEASPKAVERPHVEHVKTVIPPPPEKEDKNVNAKEAAFGVLTDAPPGFEQPGQFYDRKTGPQTAKFHRRYTKSPRTLAKEKAAEEAALKEKENPQHDKRYPLKYAPDYGPDEGSWL